MESEHRLAVIEYRQRIEELSIEMRTLQVVVEEQRGCSDEAAMLALELEKERGRLAGLCIIISVNCFFLLSHYKCCYWFLFCCPVKRQTDL